MSLVIILLFSLFLLGKGLCVDIESRVVNGFEATTFIPYQASVRVSIRDHARFGRGHTCGGVLISTRTVATAGHCLYDGTRLRNPFDLRVVLGSLNRYVHTPQTVIRTVERVVVHPEYRRGESFAHDIGLLILRWPVEFSHIVRSIGMIDHEVEAGTNCQVSGWGATEWQGFMPSELRKANVSIVSRSFCNSTVSYGGTFLDGMVCANEFNERGIVDVCQGDSGGPLQCNNKLVGLASFGAQCGASVHLPGVFVDIHFYRQWIEDNMSTAWTLKTSHLLLLIGLIITNFLRFLD